MHDFDETESHALIRALRKRGKGSPAITADTAENSVDVGVQTESGPRGLLRPCFPVTAADESDSEGESA